MCGILFVGLVVTSTIPAALTKAALVPAYFGRPWQWYRLVTYALIAPTFAQWLIVGGLIVIGGWLAEPWLDRRTMWTVAAIGAIVSGVLYVLFAPVGPPTIGGGYIAAAFAGAAVVSSAVYRRSVSRRNRVVAVGLLLLYGLAPLRPDGQSLAMFGGFIIAALYVRRRLGSGPRAVAARPSS